jgi:conjugative transposon TraJ protein
MKLTLYILPLITLALVVPFIAGAQDSGVAVDISGLRSTLNTVYNKMIANCGELIAVARGIGGLAALLYCSNRVWGHLMRGESIDFYPLMRPFGVGIAIILFPAVIGVLNGVGQPTVAGTAALVTNSNQAIATLLQQKEDALKNSDDWKMYVGPSGSGDMDKWEQLSGEADDGAFSGISNRVKFEMSKLGYNLKNQIKVWLSEILQIFYEAAALCIDTVRTFYLVILALLGPLAFALSIFDGFHHTLTAWLAKYINVFLWLPIANVLGSVIGQVQQEMIKLDIAQLKATGETSFGSTDLAYIIFLIMGIVGYFTVPTISNWIIQAGHHNAHLQKTTDGSGGAVSAAAKGAMTVASSAML